MNKVTTVGLDLAKNVLHLVGVDRHEEEVMKRMLRRAQVLEYFAKLPPCLIGMEACAGAHDWARRLKDLGHEVRLISPRFVKAYVRGNKNDYNDARAIAEAARRPGMRCVAVKTVEQQDRQALHRLRAARVAERTALCNQVRGLLAEYGVVAPKGVATLRRRIPEWLEDAESPLTPIFRQLLHRAYQQLRAPFPTGWAHGDAEHYSQARQFYISQTSIEQKHIGDAFAFELSKVEREAIRARMVSHLLNVDESLAKKVAAGLGFEEMPGPADAARPTRTHFAGLAQSEHREERAQALRGAKARVPHERRCRRPDVRGARQDDQGRRAMLEVVAPTVGGVNAVLGA